MKNVCRICLCSPKQLQPLFDGSQLTEKIRIISSVVIDEDDGFPNSVCADCIINVNSCYNFRLVVINSDEELRRRATESGKVIKTDEETSLLTSELIIKGEEGDLDLEQIDDGEESEVVEESVVKMEEVESDEPEIKEYKCKKCDFNTENLKLYRKHNRLGQHKLQRRLCSICGKMIKHTCMSSHMKCHEIIPGKCDICGKTYKNIESLRDHKTSHEARKVCEYCGKSYRHRGNYYVHVKMYHKGGLKQLNCSCCDKIFHRSDKLKRHMQTHTGERPHICEFCKKGFSSTDALKTHKRQHTNEKPYKCKLCSATYKQRVLLRNHLKTKHPGQEYEF